MKNGRSAVLNELDGIAIRVRHPGGSEGRQEIVRRAERGRASGSQTGVGAVGVV
jgi:hypothetical protein